MDGRARRASAACLSVVAALVLTACDGNADGPMVTPSSATEEGVDAGWSVQLLDEGLLGEGWTARDLPNPAAGVVDGLCGVPDVLEVFPPDEVVRFEGDDGVVTHAVIPTDDAAGLATVLVTELELCDREDPRVTDAAAVELDAALPPSDAYRFEAYDGSLDVTTDAVWVVTAVDEGSVSVVGASTTDLFDEPADPVELATWVVERLYDGDGSGR